MKLPPLSMEGLIELPKWFWFFGQGDASTLPSFFYTCIIIIIDDVVVVLFLRQAFSV